MIFLTSDCHFNHKNILAYEPESRPFATIEEMNEAIINNWNSVVTDEDEVWVCGDFFMGQITAIDPILDRLKGKIHLVRGNHDQKNRMKIYEERGIDIHDIAYIQYKGRYFILCHFPNESAEFVRMVVEDNSEVVWLYGHVHGKAPKGYVNGTYHVGADTNNLTPISIQQIWEECWPQEIMTPEVTAYKKEHDTPCHACQKECGFDNRCGEFAKERN